VGLRGISSYKIHNCAYETLGFEDLKHSGIFATEERIETAMIAVDDFLEEV
jgi:hypothetical protein